MKIHLNVTAVATAVAIVACIGASPTSAQPAPDGKGAAATLVVVRDVCLPMLMGAKIDTVAKSAGLKNRHDGWVLPIAGKRHIELSPPGGSNPHVCEATVIHDPGAGASILAALRQWASGHSPPLQAIKTEQVATGAIYRLTTSTWEGKTANGNLAVVYAEDKSPDGKPVAGDLDQSTLTVALTPATS
jgi:hypothetical protein